MAQTIWERLEECTRALSEPFRASEIVGWFRRHYPDVNEGSLRTHIQGATSNASPQSRGQLASRRPLITRVDHGLYERFRPGSGDVTASVAAVRASAAPRRPERDVDIAGAVDIYLRDRDPSARYTSFDYCFNHFQQHRSAVADVDSPTGLEASCLHLGFYLASWGMYRGSSELLQRSARHLIPLVQAIAAAPPALWELDLDAYDSGGIALILETAGDLRRALQPVTASETLITKVMLGVFGCVPAFDTYFKNGFAVATFGSGSLRRISAFYREHAATIEQLRQPTLDFTTGEPTNFLYPRAKIVDMVFFIVGGYRSRS